MNSIIREALALLTIVVLCMPASCVKKEDDGVVFRHSMLTNIAIILDRAANGPLKEPK